MKSVFAAMIAICFAFSSGTPVNAANVYFSGVIANEIGAGVFNVGDTVVLATSWVAGPGAVAVSQASLSVNGQVWSNFNPGTVSVETSGGFSRLRVSLPTGFSDTSVGGYASTGLDFNVRAASDLGLSSDATQANWDAIYFSSLTQTLPAAGFFLADGAAYTFEGAAVPEPSSIAILSGLGLVFARGAWRRRNAKTIEIA